MANLQLKNVNKIYDNKVQAVFDFNLEIEDKEFIVFVGPSGCGKSTTLRMIAGLEEITSGELYIDGQKMNDVLPKDRDIAMVFQSYALYPHMTVYDNMAFGLKLKKMPKEEIDQRVRHAAEILEITPYLKRKPKALSGGQRQRVALGRAIVRNAKVFLMDEPLSNLDAKLRVQMRTEIIKLHESLGATTIYVTHDQTEAMTMASRIVVMKDGYIQQIGSPKMIYNYPANMFVAGFIGSPAMNFLNGVCKEAGKIEIDGRSFNIPEMFKDDLKPYIGKEIVLGIRPEDIHYEGIVAEAFPDTPFDFKVEVCELLGHEFILHGHFGPQELLAKVSSRVDVKAGDEIKLAMDVTKLHFFDQETGIAINPEYGTLEEFKQLIQATHDHHMKIMIDIVINHTAYDHPFTQTHPEYYYHKPDGNFGNRVGDWTDILDLNYSCEALREEMINMLCYWAKLGVDGYRCDVASLVPVSFWQQAAEAVAKINPDHFWLAESVEPEFIRALRSEGFEVATDSELYTAFDCLYDYDIYDQFKAAVSEKTSLQPYKQAVRDQQWRYPANFLKLRFLENHDQPRIASYTQDHDKTLNWVGYSFFVQGTAFVYAGQEAWNTHQPSLFTKDLVDWTQRDPAYEALIHRLNEIRRMDFMGAHRQFVLHDNSQEVLVCEYQCEDTRVFGIFNVRGLEGDLPLATIEGEFVNLIDNQPVIVEKGQLKLSRKPQIFVCSNLSAE